MSIINKRAYMVKFIDEMGNCYLEQKVNGIQDRQRIVKEWKKNDHFYRCDVKDVIVLVKNTGEELWLYDYEPSMDY